MPFNLADSLEAKLNLPVAWKDDVVNMVVYIERLTPELLKDITEGAQASQVDVICKVVSQLTHSWDLHWNGEEFPPTFENLQQCPLKFLVACAEGILGLINGNPPKGAPSLNTSAQPAS